MHSPSVYEAALGHWRALARPAYLLDEFRSNYLGSWLDNEAFALDLARDFGLPDDAGARLVERLHDTRELVSVSDVHGVHVFEHPEGPAPKIEQAARHIPHLVLLPSAGREFENG